MEKLDAGLHDGLILAAAGLERLGLAHRIHQVIAPEISLHAVGQGALGIECVADNQEVLEQIRVLNHEATRDCCMAERAFLRELEGGCQVPIGVNSAINGEDVVLTGMVAILDGRTLLLRDQCHGPRHTPEAVGRQLALALKTQGAAAILEEVFAAACSEA